MQSTLKRHSDAIHYKIFRSRDPFSCTGKSKIDKKPTWSVCLFEFTAVNLWFKHTYFLIISKTKILHAED